ncbi:hypothetical protein Ga0074812_106157 [Parafrankia irregularis]|uniref:Cold-shock protein n=1 Tax=Parafrankia irregularis TaxID=795642 RepID=A0A0S4QKS3_9ACTN|nr:MULTISPECIES: cold-shock protein [Parafrankia]MBE3202120.1 cold shock domain-containing protein [Parafrankia sp. CH37]CUU55902.1 hypothetical protein Ga0074812_106157 [Parafrankia irregularis]
MTMLRGGRLMAAVLPLALVTALASVACTGATAAGPARDSLGTGATTGLDADAVAVRVDWIGGFVTAQMLATRLPLVAIYHDGRVLTEGPVAAVWPGPALPNLQLRRISAADVQKLVDHAVAAGVGTEPDFGQPPIADAPSTRFTVRTAGGVRTMEVTALTEADGTGLTAAQQSARKAAQRLYTELTDLPATLGTGAVSEPEEYSPTAIAAFAEPWAANCPAPSSDGSAPSGSAPSASTPSDGAPAGSMPAGDPPDLCGGGGGLSREARPWPGPPLPGEPYGAGLGLSCVTSSGGDATKVLAAARTADAITPWTSEGATWRLTFRPLLPDESSCADLPAGG